MCALTALPHRNATGQGQHVDLETPVHLSRWGGDLQRFPWRISRRAPLIGEHNTKIFRGELGIWKAVLTLLAESEVL